MWNPEPPPLLVYSKTRLIWTWPIIWALWWTSMRKWDGTWLLVVLHVVPTIWAGRKLGTLLHSLLKVFSKVCVLFSSSLLLVSGRWCLLDWTLSLSHTDTSPHVHTMHDHWDDEAYSFEHMLEFVKLVCSNALLRFLERSAHVRICLGYCVYYWTCSYDFLKFL